MDMLVHHQGVGPDVVRLHQPVEDSVEPSEVVVQVQCARDRGREVQQEMRNHDHVVLIADYFPGPLRVGLDYVFLEPWGKRILEDIPAYKDRGLEFGIFGIVEGDEAFDDDVVLILVFVVSCFDRF